MPHPRPTSSSLGFRPSITARYFSSSPSDSASRRTPCPPGTAERWLQVRLGCVQLSSSCPFRLLHTFPSPRPARSYPRLWIRRSSFERRRDFNPPELRAAQRTIGLIDPIALVGRLQMRAAAFVQLECIRLHPTSNATAIHLDTTFGHQLRDMFVRQRISEMPAHA